MRTPQEIWRFAENKYRDYLTSVVRGETFFPLEVPLGKLSPTAPLAELIDAVRELVESSKEKTYFGYRVALRDTPTRRYGVQRLPYLAAFDDEENFLRYLGRVKEAQTFRQNVVLTRSSVPGLEPWLVLNTPKIIERAEAWPSLMKVCAWFVAHPRPMCFAREIRVGVHTKFIEEHEPVLDSMLAVLLPNDHDPLADNFHSRFFLRDKEPLVRVRIIDEALMATTGILLHDFCVPVSVFYALPFHQVPRIVVIENEITFLTLPRMPDTVLINGMGNGVHLISDAPWLRGGERTVYWGDVDTLGVTILGWLRRKLPRVRSVLMNEETLKRFPEAEVEDPTVAAPQLADHLLTEGEWACYRALSNKSPRRRLEQERIPIEHAISEIEHAFAE